MEITVSKENYDAALFDLDGVLTATAKLHAFAWKQMFDDYLRQREDAGGPEYREFTVESDYKLYVDGKPRYDGVASFLASRDIKLPWGNPDDNPTLETVCGLGNRKNILINQLIEERGVDLLPGSLEFVNFLRGLGIRTGVVSSSKNCQAILQAAGIEDLFDTRIDGVVAAERGIPGKPRPDTFLEAAKELEADPARSIVIEDAIAGVQAGKSGGFGLVIGIEHDGQAEALRSNGADIAVQDLRELIA